MAAEGGQFPNTILVCSVFLPIAQADDSDQMTKFTFTQAVEIPGRVLPADTYRTYRFVLQKALLEW